MNVPASVRHLAWLCFLPLLSSAAESSLAEAVRVGDATAWRAALARKVEVNAPDARGNTALHYAALRRDVDAVRALLAAGATVDARNASDATPLLYGAGHAEIVELLLARGANPNAASKTKDTPLMAAASHPDSFAAVQKLVAAGADVKAMRVDGVESILTRAIEAGDRRTIAFLLEKGARVDSKDETSVSPLSMAAFIGDLETARLLLDRGANLDFRDTFTGPSVNTALYAGHEDFAQFLIARGAKLDLPSTSGHGTPPMVFAAYNQRGDPAVVQAMLARKANVNAANEEGATALSWAQRNGADTPLVAALRKAGAKAPTTPRAKAIPSNPVPDSASERAALVRQRLPATLAVLERSSAAFLENAFVQRQNCVSCHGQDLTAVVLERARVRGLAVSDLEQGRILAALQRMWGPRAERGRQMRAPLPDTPASSGYGFFALGALKYPADEMTDGVTHYLLRSQRAAGNWADYNIRPPMEDGEVVATAWAALGVRDYAPVGMETERADSQRRSAKWLAARQPASHNEAVFVLLGLNWSGEPASRVGFAVERLVKSQRADGGWSQLPTLESDAWATGTALYALHEAGGMAATDPVYQRGVAFLLRTQFDDGSWWVRSRTWAFQPHFNGQFPHGKDQWISQGASGWAALALLATLEPATNITPPTAAQLLATYANSPAAKRAAAAAEKNEPAPTNASAAVRFTRDIQPLLDRSCSGCHGGEKPRAGLKVATLADLRTGGQSREPAIVAGSVSTSPLWQYAAGKVEDLEMPPLDKREKYPALSEKELALVRSWIEAGAPN